MTTQQRAVFGQPTNARGLITDTVGRWLLVQTRHGGSGWRFPGGQGKPGESPSDTCCRELWEEIGVAVTPIDLLVTTFTVPLSPVQMGRGRLNFLFDCGVHRAGTLPVRIQRAEILAAEWIPKAEALPLLHPGNRHMIDQVRRGRHYDEYVAASTPSPLHPQAESLTRHPRKELGSLNGEPSEPPSPFPLAGPRVWVDRSDILIALRQRARTAGPTRILLQVGPASARPPFPRGGWPALTHPRSVYA
ncbi:NUDIX hydrolase [Amycolatopsis mediterranei]|uniref:NUDIX hydrolase n=1 Tax=Amycolatopsis mediterranei TaxID=33910 RepID=UPI003417858D